MIDKTILHYKVLEQLGDDGRVCRDEEDAAAQVVGQIGTFYHLNKSYRS